MLYSPEGGSPQQEERKKEEDEQEDGEGETLSEQKEERKFDDEDNVDGDDDDDDDERREEDYELEEVELDDTTKQRDDSDEHLDYPHCISLDLRASDDEKSHDLTPSPRPLSQESRKLTASELLLNKSVLGPDLIPF